MGLRLKFRRGGSFVLKTKAVRVSRLADLAGVEDQVLDLYRRGKWRREWVLVMEVASAGR
ncbi:hypothetical protein [Streptomyces morookaense]|uniref:Uncharacterized protein n=1 Tax=Streptomyces morookaense TaxID=1970 RepID=A0A7Y7E947_STRMO|nr:hypothetical protein [Streptomyces morookaense]NVK80027.1 hypothetical protein [Streptomyces morookaense]GHF41598.1 hypothetical protein GCM10010359_50330 [Streptomyces morookaense]